MVRGRANLAQKKLRHALRDADVALELNASDAGALATRAQPDHTAAGGLGAPGTGRTAMGW